MGTSSDETAAEPSLSFEEPVAVPTREGEEVARLQRLVAVLGELSGADEASARLIARSAARMEDLLEPLASRVGARTDGSTP